MVKLRAFSTINVWADDVAKAVAWYRPARAATEPGGASMHWHVDEVLGSTGQE